MLNSRSSCLHVLRRYDAYRGPLEGVRKGVLVSTSSGKATAYALNDLQSRGAFFISPGEDVYEGMVVGEHTRCVTFVHAFRRVCFFYTHLLLRGIAAVLFYQAFQWIDDRVPG